MICVTEENSAPQTSTCLDELLSLIHENCKSLTAFHIHTDDIYEESDNGFEEKKIIQIFSSESIDALQDIDQESVPQFEFPFTSTTFSTILLALADNSSVLEFGFSHIDYQPEIIQNFFNMLEKNSFIQRIRCENISIDQEMLYVLFETVSRKPYERIFFSGFSIDLHILESFFDSLLLHNSSLQFLELNSCELEDGSDCVPVLLKYFPQLTCIQSLRVWPENMFREYDQAFSEALQNTFSLTDFFLDNEMPLCEALVKRNQHFQEQKRFKIAKPASF